MRSQKIARKISATSTLLLLLAAPVHADKVCLFPHADNSHTSEDRHCSNNCSGWAERQPTITITMDMPAEWADKGAFFNDPSASCGGVGCTWATIQSTSITNVGQTIEVKYRNWGRPITVGIEASICVLD